MPTTFENRIDFNQKHYHPKYKERTDQMRKWLNVFKGGDAGKQYLKRFDGENDGDYTDRKSVTAFLKLSASVLSVYATQLFATEPTRELPPDLQPYIEDIDGDGTNMDTMLSQQYGSMALPVGLTYFLVTKSTPDPDEPIMNLQQEKAQHLRPMVVPFSPFDLLKWDFDFNGKLKYVVLRDTRTVSDGWDVPHQRYELLRIWLPDAYAVYRRALDSKSGKPDDEKWELYRSGDHQLGEVPLVCLYNIRVSRFDGQTELDQLGLSDLNIDLYNKMSWLDQGLKHQGFPMCVIKTAMDKTEIGTIRHGPNEALVLKPGDEFDIHETTGQALGLMDDVIQNRISTFLDMGFRQITMNTPSAAKEAAEKKRLDMGQFVAALKDKNEQIQEAERGIWRLMGMWQKKTPEQAAAMAEKSVVRTVEIDEQKVKATLAELKDFFLSNLLSRKSTLTQAKEQGYLTPEFDIDAETELLETDAARDAQNMLGDENA